MGPFGTATEDADISVAGPISYNPSMHGSVLNPSFSTFNDAQRYSYINSNDDTATRIMELDAKLQMKLGPEYISQRPGPGGGPKLTYIEGWKVINLANEIFGHNGWSSSIVNLTTDYMDSTEGSGSPTRWNIGVTAIVKVTLRDGVFHEDVGYGTAENQRNKGAALDKAKKEAVTDALKRSLRNFGNVLGNCLYDKKYAQNIVKVKVPEPKFNKEDLYRRPEFQESKLQDSRPPHVPPSHSHHGPSLAERTESTIKLEPQISTTPPVTIQPQLGPAKPVSFSANNSNPAGTKRYASTKDLVEAAMAAKNAQPPAPPPQQQQQIDTSAAPLLSGTGVRHTESFGDSEFGDLDDEGFIAVNMNEIDCGPPIHYEEEEHDMTVEVPQPRSAFSLRDTPFGQPSSSRHVTFNPRVGNNSTTTSAPSRPVQPSSGGQFVFPDTAEQPKRLSLSGTKRNVDAMQTRPTQGPGMGLQNSGPRLASVSETSDGPDPKRKKI